MGGESGSENVKNSQVECAPVGSTFTPLYGFPDDGDDLRDDSLCPAWP
jgi:hypothetical protein